MMGQLRELAEWLGRIVVRIIRAILITIGSLGIAWFCFTFGWGGWPQTTCSFWRLSELVTHRAPPPCYVGK